MDGHQLIPISVVLLLTVTTSVIIGLLKGKAIYKKETKQIIAQIYAQDIVTSFIIPFYIYALFLLYNNSVYGNILIAGFAGYFLYTYASYAFYCYFNKLFLINLTAFSLSMFTFIFATNNLIDAMNYIDFHKKQLLVGGGIWFIILGCFLLFLWLSQLLPATIKNKQAPILDETQGKLVIQVLDLGVLAPTLIVFGILLIIKNYISYVQAFFFILLVKGITPGLAITAMAINQTREGSPEKPGIIIFSIVSFISILFFIWVLLDLNVTGINLGR